jgi:DNA transformation protein
VSDDYLDWLLGQLEQLGPVAPKRMFGGVGLYHDGTFFGVVDDDVMFLRVDDASRPAYEERGMGPFQPIPTAKPMRLYWQVPDDILADPQDLAEWARRALAAARAAKKRPRARRRRVS